MISHKLNKTQQPLPKIPLQKKDILNQALFCQHLKNSVKKPLNTPWSIFLIMLRLITVKEEKRIYEKYHH